jgi:hypothetical protein
MDSTQMPNRIAMKQPFASGAGDGGLIPIVNQEGDKVNFIEGFPPIYAAPASSGGKYVSRGEMNAIGNLASNDLFYHKCGGLNVFDGELSNVIGGYPKGAVLKYHHNDFLYDVISLQDNNTWNYIEDGVDNEHWAYLSVPEKMVDDVFFEGGTGVATGGTILGVIKAEKTSGLIVKTGLTPVWTDGGTQINWSTGTYSGFVGVSVAIKNLGTTIPESITFPVGDDWAGWLNLSGDYARCTADSSQGCVVSYMSQKSGVFTSLVKGNYYALGLLCGAEEIKQVITGLTRLNLLEFSSITGTLKLNYA